MLGFLVWLIQLPFPVSSLSWSRPDLFSGVRPTTKGKKRLTQNISLQYPDVMANIRYQEVLNKVVKYLQEIAPKMITRNDCATNINEPTTPTYRALKACDVAGLVVVDRTRSPWTYGWKKGAIPNISPTFPLWNDHIQETTRIRDTFNEYISLVPEAGMPPYKNIPFLLIMSALASMDSDDQEEILNRDEWLKATVAALYPFYNAYRIIKVIDSIPDKKRLAKSQGFNYITSWGLDMREIFRVDRKALLKRVTDFLNPPKRPVSNPLPVVEPESEPEPEPYVEKVILPETAAEYAERMAAELGETKNIWDEWR